MSLLEDIFLQDEANEARELERVIEGDEYDEQPRSVSPSGDESDNDRREDEAEEDKRRVDPSSTKTKRVIKNPRFVLNPARLTGPRGIQVIPEHFKDFKFKGKGHEKDDLDMVLKKLEHWAYRLYPKFTFGDCLKKIETLGKKRPVMVHLHKIRTDQLLSEETVVQKDSSDDEIAPPQVEDEFDKLLQQQIEIARSTPAPGSVKKAVTNDDWARLVETPKDNRLPLIKPTSTSSPTISEEQRERMLKNRKLAEERRLARLKQAASNCSINNTVHIDDKITIETHNTENTNNNREDVPRKINKSNVIESSDSEDDCNVITANQSITVDIHTKINNHNSKSVLNNDIPQIMNITNADDEAITVDDEEIINGSKNTSIEMTRSNQNVVERTSNNDEKEINNSAHVDAELMNVDENNINYDEIISLDIDKSNQQIQRTNNDAETNNRTNLNAESMIVDDEENINDNENGCIEVTKSNPPAEEIFSNNKKEINNSKDIDAESITVEED